MCARRPAALRAKKMRANPPAHLCLPLAATAISSAEPPSKTLEPKGLFPFHQSRRRRPEGQVRKRAEEAGVIEEEEGIGGREGDVAVRLDAVRAWRRASPSYGVNPTDAIAPYTDTKPELPYLDTTSPTAVSASSTSTRVRLLIPRQTTVWRRSRKTLNMGGFESEMVCEMGGESRHRKHGRD
ncbi:hypothetical protein U9M48_028666 [Paspalum notatum var. saurae]|uniref:Uncharacterized protein n=1 Tax=Paspalum notatum var. saurae TaxID=547442 RepID=A0AAQ3TX90_PASNO